MKPNWNIRVAMAVLAILILVRPGIGNAVDAERPVGSDLEVLFVIDETLSMSALDYAGARSRLEGVREDLTQITTALPDARFGIIGFGHDAEVELAFSNSRAAVRRAVLGVVREPMMKGTGTVLDRPLDLMTTTLEKAKAQHPDRRRIVILLSDGENTKAGAVQRSFAAIEPLVTAGAVLGYGTSVGGRMPTGGEPPWTFVRDLGTGQDALSRIDEPNLKKIASEMGVEYAYRGGSGDLSDWAIGLSKGGETAPTGDKDAFELYWILALLLAALAIVELRLDVLAWREAKEVAR